MCERILAKLPSMTADERSQLCRNCARAIERANDPLVAQEARRILDELAMIERREAAFLARQCPSRQIEYAFRRRPADAGERRLIRALHDGALRLPVPSVITAAGMTAEDVQGEAASTHRLRWADRPAWVQQLQTMCAARRHLLPFTEDCIAEGIGASRPSCGGACPLIGADTLAGCARLSGEAIEAFTRTGYLDPFDAGARPSLGDGLRLPSAFSLAASSPADTRVGSGIQRTRAG